MASGRGRAAAPPALARFLLRVTPVRLYLLEFDGPESLARGFERVLECSRAESCSLEAGGRRLRFFAPERPAEALLERIYADGGLVWCSRHDLSRAPEVRLRAAS